MTTLTLELPPEVYRRLHAEAARLGKPPQTVVQEWLLERFAVSSPVPPSTRPHVRQALRAAGLLVEEGSFGPPRLDQHVGLEEVAAALARVGGKPLSAIVLEQRGPQG